MYQKRISARFYKVLALLLCFATLITSVQFTVFAVDDDEDFDTVTVTVNYVYASNQSMVAQPYRAQIATGSEFKKTLEIPKLLNYSIPTDKALGLNDGITLSKSESDGSYSLEFDLNSVTTDVTVTLYYVAGTAKYTVYHYYQNLENDDYSDEPRVVELMGDIDAYTDAMADNIHGFHCKGVPQTTIAADGTTIVEIYYDRDYYTVTFDVNGGVNGPSPIYAKYGTTFEASDIQSPSRAGYTFAGWDPSLSTTMTIEDNATYKAVWISDKTQADYTIVIWGQNANDDGYSYYSSNEAWGNVGHEITWDASTKINHVHGSSCYAQCDKEVHVHTDACLNNEDCPGYEHTHDGACCSLEAHTHSASCYSGAGSVASTGSALKPSNPTEGQVYQGYLGTYIYISGTWYNYTGSVTSGNAATSECGKTLHTHGTGCNHDKCDKEEHTHVATCFTCGKEEHTHDSSCAKLLCTIPTTEILMGSLALDASLWIYEKSDTVTVDANGSTVLNVYFVRKQFTLHFRKANASSDTYGTITARWGQNIQSEYEKIVEKAGSNFWSTNTNASSPWTNFIGVMPQQDIIYYLKSDSSTKKSTMTYYAEDLNGNYQTIFTVTFPGTSYTVTVEDRYEFEGFEYDHGTALKENCNGAEFYYKRKSYKLDFYSASKNDADKEYSVLYQKPLGEYDYVPTEKPNTVESDAIFVGWYQNPECTGEPYILSDHIMPSDNIALYAKWVNGLYTVRTYQDDTLSNLYTYDGYNGIQKDIEKYTLATAPTEPIEDGFVFAGWFYKENEEEKPFSFTMPITRDYDLYPKFSTPTAVTYTVHYYIKGTTTKIADDRTNSVMIGTTVTEKAKMGTELNLLDSALQNKYYPTNTSTSVIINKADQEIVFEYTEATSVQYTVYYQDSIGNNLIDPKVKTTDFSTVTETYEPISGYSPRQFRITQDLSSDASKNKIIFIYDPTLTTLTIQKSGASSIDTNQTFLFRVCGIDDNTRGVDIIVTVHGNGKTTITDLPIGKYTVTEQVDWSWRYEPSEASKTVTLTAGENTVSFDNHRTEEKWLDGDNYKVNLFD